MEFKFQLSKSNNFLKFKFQTSEFKYQIYINFVNKNWPNDLKIGCKPFYSLVEPIGVDAYLETLEEFEITFERDEILEI